MTGSGLLAPLAGALQACLSVLLTMCCGVVVRWLRLIQEEPIDEMSGLAVKVFLPALLVVNLGSNLHLENAMNYVPVLVWSLVYTFCSIGLVHGLVRILKLPHWVTATCAFNNTTSLPLLLLQSLESVGSLKPILPEGDTMTSAIERAQSYFLVCAVVSKTAGYIIGPKLLQENKGNGNEQDTEGGQSSQERQWRQGDGEDDGQPTEESDEQTSLLRQTAPRRFYKATKRVRGWGRRISSYFPDRVKQELMAPFGSPFADVAVASALLGAFLGLVPSLHRAFFNPADNGGIFNAWLTASVKNIGKLFTTFQIFIVGCTLGVSFERMKASRSSGKIPIRAIITIFIVRMVAWPILSISLIYGLAKKTTLVRDDPILWFTMMLMPQGPPALVNSGFAELAGVSEQEKMAVAKTLTILYALSPAICLGLTGSLKASEAVAGHRGMGL